MTFNRMLVVLFKGGLLTLPNFLQGLLFTFPNMTFNLAEV